MIIYTIEVNRQSTKQGAGGSTLLDVPSCNPLQYQGKIIMQTWDNDKKPNFGPYFGLSCFFVSVSSQTLFQAIILCNFK